MLPLHSRSSPSLLAMAASDLATDGTGFAVPASRLTHVGDEDAAAGGPSSGASSAKHSLADEDSRGSSGSTAKKGKKSVSFDTSFPAARIIEYQWPAGSGNYFMIQEQITEFLQIKSFKRKYPDFNRRVCDIEERRYLQDYMLTASDPLCDLGLTALRSEDVMELMAKEYPAKYCEYLTVIDSKHQADYTKITRDVSKTYSTVSVDKSKMAEFVKKAMASVKEYNETINQERRVERRVCMDLQTYTTHYPIGLGSKNKQLQRNTRQGRVRHFDPSHRHPVALVPGQFQDWYLRYTPQELKYLPLNTVLYGPVVTDPSKLPPILSSQEDSDDSASDSDSGSESCSSRASCDSASSSGSDIDGPPPLPLLMRDDKMKGKPNAYCKECKRIQNRQNQLEQMVHCADCCNSSHPSCLELTSEMVDVIRSYPWQCTECKTCITCAKSTDEENMMFCDKCDRGYHTSCVGLTTIPTGKWVCRLCAQCAVCGTTRPLGLLTPPAPTSSTSTRKSAAAAAAAAASLASSSQEWQHETIKILSPNGDTLTRHNLLCLPCYQQRRK